MRSYTLKEAQSTRVSPPSRHTLPSKNGDTHGKKNPPFPRRIKRPI